MTDNKAPAYPWYPRDFAGDEPVQLMSLEEEGAYRRLLDHQWMHGSIPADISQVAKVCKNVAVTKMRKLWPAIVSCFVPVEGAGDRLQNRKLERVRQERRGYLEKQSTAGKLGAAARWGDKQTDAGANATAISDVVATPLADECLASASASASAPNKEELVTAIAPNGSFPKADEQAVLAHYRSQHPKRLRGGIPSKTLRLLRKALQSYSVEELNRAIDHNAASTFHRKGNFMGLDLILRDSEKIDFFLELTEDTPGLTDEPAIEYLDG